MSTNGSQVYKCSNTHNNDSLLPLFYSIWGKNLRKKLTNTQVYKYAYYSLSNSGECFKMKVSFSVSSQSILDRFLLNFVNPIF